MCNVWIELAGLALSGLALTALTFGVKTATAQQRENRIGGGLALLIGFCLLGHHLLLNHGLLAGRF